MREGDDPDRGGNVEVPEMKTAKKKKKFKAIESKGLGSCVGKGKMLRNQDRTIWLRMLFAKLVNTGRGVDFVKSLMLGIIGALVHGQVGNPIAHGYN